MKKFRILTVLLAVAGMVFLNSCGGDDEHAAPTITLSHSTTWVLDFSSDTAQQVLFTADVNAEAEIETFTITEIKIDQNGGESQSAYQSDETAKFKGETSKRYTFDKTFYASDFTQYKEYDYKFSVTDKDGQSYSVTVKVTKKAEEEATEYTVEPMGAQSNSTLGSYYDVENNKVYLQDEADANQAAVDFVYYYGSTNKATMAAPNDTTVNGTGEGSLSLTADWTIQNATVFYRLTNVSYDDINTVGDINNLIDNQDNPLTRVNMLNVDDVVGFKTVNGTKGIFVVKALTESNDGSITIKVKVNVAAN